jgi:hypothetical protein
VTSAFIVQVGSQLQPDPNEETAALLRVLIHKIDNTTFGGDVPTVPQWTGPPRTIVRVEAILYASLAASLFSAFLAMLGKQWLNRYASIDMRGSAIERSQNRQRKLDGIITWYFDHVMEALPVILQFALLLLGCALSLYLWGIDRTVALVVLGATSFGVVFYAFIVVAGTASVSCPYQTPGAHILRHTWSTLHSASSSIIGTSVCIELLTPLWTVRIFGYVVEGLAALPFRILVFPLALAIDTYHLAREIAEAFVALSRRWFSAARDLGPQTIVSDLRCISWVLQTSLDEAVRLSTLRSLATMTTLADFNPVLVSACFDVLTGCAAVFNDKVVIGQGLEELADVSALCCLRTFSHLAVMDPTSNVLKDVLQRYTRTFPLWTNFEGFPYYPNFSTIHITFHSSAPGFPWDCRRDSLGKNRWEDYKLPSNKQVVLARALAELAPFEYRKRGPVHKVPRWILRFALHYLSQDPLPPTSVVADCLSIIAIDLGCAVSDTTTLDERYINI